MIKSIWISLVGLITILVSCSSSTKSNIDENKSVIVVDQEKEQVDNIIEIDSNKTNQLPQEVETDITSKSSEFVTHLKNGEKLSSFFNDNWAFIYHSDDRCDGATDGQVNNLKSFLIDSIITLQVKNDSEDAWACDKKESKTYELNFDLKKEVADWERFEINNSSNQNQGENIIYVEGGAASDYLKLYYNEANLIVKLEYRSEDPG